MEDKMLKVGNTPLLRINTASGLEVLVKDESRNPFGTFKDRKSRDVAEFAKAAEIDYVMAITSGNYGFSLSNFLRDLGINTILFVPYGIDRRVLELLEQKATVIPVDLEEQKLTTEKLESIAGSRLKLAGNKVINATNFYDDAYLDIFREIKREIGKQDKEVDYVILPCGSGELFIAALRYYYLSNTKVIAVTTDNRSTKATMLYAKYRPSLDRILAHGDSTRYGLIRANEDEILRAYGWAKEKINCEPSSAAAFAAFERHKGIFKPSDTIVVLNTGNGLNNFS
ncbi:MAG: PLP-dependent lyase/thiolase [Nanoarchaeota archaeon]